jgi:hypothetical protein
MNWENVNLTDSYEREQNIIDSLDFDTLLLEISCNISNDKLNREEIRKQFETDLKNRIVSAREIFNNNIDNILKQAQEERKN